jgi:hypothetical protein
LVDSLIEKCVTFAHALNAKRETISTRSTVVDVRKNWKLGLVVQLVRISPCHGEGRGFESRPDRQQKKLHRKMKLFFVINFLGRELHAELAEVSPVQTAISQEKNGSRPILEY